MGTINSTVTKRIKNSAQEMSEKLIRSQLNDKNRRFILIDFHKKLVKKRVLLYN